MGKEYVESYEFICISRKKVYVFILHINLLAPELFF